MKTDLKPDEKIIAVIPAPPNLMAEFIGKDTAPFLVPVVALAVIEQTFPNGKAFRLDGFGADRERFGECDNFDGFQFVESEKPLSEIISEGFEKVEKAILAGFRGDELLGVESPIITAAKIVSADIRELLDTLFEERGIE
jgi:hypothetical protein